MDIDKIEIFKDQLKNIKKEYFSIENIPQMQYRRNELLKEIQRLENIIMYLSVVTQDNKKDTNRIK